LVDLRQLGRVDQADGSDAEAHDLERTDGS